eukprot:TRINITY_DN8712_c0_g1_i2.p1 TRINITY_DN8712_c0_g1~~TRINITY_DN8712_c0_g1_i2.p1  ORF type:complete len:723 (+),score=167.81 TRINITY_DN8712_c0_g1_i2:23-2191(+)
MDYRLLFLSLLCCGVVHGEYCSDRAPFVVSDTIMDLHVNPLDSTFIVFNEQFGSRTPWLRDTGTNLTGPVAIANYSTASFLFVQEKYLILMDDYYAHVFHAKNLTLITSIYVGYNLFASTTNKDQTILFISNNYFQIFVLNITDPPNISFIQRFDTLTPFATGRDIEFLGLLAFNDIDLLFVQISSNGVWKLNVNNGNATQVIDGGLSREVVITPDGRYLVSSGPSCRFYNAMDGTFLFQLDFQSSTILSSPFDLSNSSRPIIYDGFSSKVFQFEIVNGTSANLISQSVIAGINDAVYSSITRCISPSRCILVTRVSNLITGGFISSIRIIEQKSQCASQVQSTVHPIASNATIIDGMLIASVSSDDKTATIAAIVSILGVAIIAGGIAVLVFAHIKGKIRIPGMSRILQRNDENSGEISMKIQDPNSLDYKLGAWKIQSKDVQLGKLLGSGAYGVVYKAYWRNADVAIKQLKDEDVSNETFLKEALQMKGLRPHVNVCKFLGVIMEENYPVSIVTEFVSEGALWDLIIESKIDLNFDLCAILARDAAAGMAHIHAENILHCDLAARNLLVQQRGSEYVVKVADFGMSHMSNSDAYDVKANTVIPVRWCSPEVFVKHEFSKASDVWAFGIVLWEIAQASKPYYNMESNKEVAEYVIGGGRLGKPTRIRINDEYWEIAKKCWDHDPRNRPTFEDLTKQIEGMIPVGKRFKSFHEDPNSEDVYL